MTAAPTTDPPRCGRFDQACPTAACRGMAEPGVCDHWRRLTAWRAVPAAEQAARAEAATRTQLDPRLRDAVLACPDRGPVLPVSQQADCGCRGRELTECRAGGGSTPGRVTLADCFACRAPTLPRGPTGLPDDGSKTAPS